MLRYPRIIGILVGLTLILTCRIIAADACFRGKPLPECRTFWITEAGALYRFGLAETHHEWYETLMYSWELGLMFNRSMRHALGGTLFFDFDDYTNNVQVGFRPRYRRWLWHGISLDIAPGIILSASKSRGFAVSGEAIVYAHDFIAVTLRLDMKEGRAMGYAGMRFCSYPGLVVGIAGPIIAAAIWASDFNSPGGGRL